MTLFGDQAQFAIEWTPHENGTETDLVGLGWGGVRLWLDSSLVWAGEHDTYIAWTWIDLVEHLARSWNALLWEETMPFGVRAVHPEQMTQAGVLRRVRGANPHDLEAAMFAWQHRHDLAAGLHGIYLPSVWVMPLGNMARILAGRHEVSIRRHDLVAILEALAAQILTAAGSSAERTRQAALWWGRRAAA